MTAQLPTSPIDLHDPRTRDEIQRTITGIPGIITARIVPGYDRPIDELHALVEVERSPKQVARDIQTVLFARFDLDIDYRVISVVQLDDVGPVVVEEGGGHNRLVLASVAVTSSGVEATITVTLSDDEGTRYQGSATAPTSATARRSAAALAALEALDGVLGEHVAMGLHGVSVQAFGDLQVVIAVVTVRGRRAEEVVSGSAVIRGDETDAIVRAVLDALNRMVRASSGS